MWQADSGARDGGETVARVAGAALGVKELRCK